MIQTLLFELTASHLLSAAIMLCLVAVVIALIHLVNERRELIKRIEQQKNVPLQNVETELLLRTMKVATWTIDVATGRLQYENDYRQRGNAFRPGGHSRFADTYEQIHPDDQERVAHSLERLCKGEVTDYHEQYRASAYATDDYYWAESYATVAEYSEQGHPITIVGASMIIDERKKLEQDLLDAQQKATESDRMKSAFLSNISHEIRTPLNAIVGFSEIMANLDDPEEKQKLIEIIRRNNAVLLRIINDMVNVSRIESGEEAIVRRPVNLNQLLKKTVNDQQQLVGDNQTTLEARLPEQPTTISSDEGKIGNILQNFISNALKFTPNGTITVGYQPLKETRKVRIYVKDTGKGIAKADQARIFDKFTKLDEFSQGTGLGLYISKQFAHSIGGIIGVESKEGEGSTFWLQLPVS